MSYTDAPSTDLLATHCCCCGRPLLDASSVEAGIGPICAERHGLPHGSEQSGEANKLVHKIAALGVEHQESAEAITRIRELGFEVLAKVLEERRAGRGGKAKIKIVEDGPLYIVRTPYSAEAAAAFRTIPGRRWDPEAKRNAIPVAKKRELFALLAKAFPGELAEGPKGLFRLPAA